MRGIVSVSLLGALVGALVGALGLVGCANDPVYIRARWRSRPGRRTRWASPPEGKGSVQLPIKTETASDKAKRDALAAKLAPVEVPYVRIGDIEIEVEWTIKNLDTKAGKALVELNGANEYFAYDPSTIRLAPVGDDAPPTPGLSGDIRSTFRPAERSPGCSPRTMSARPRSISTRSRAATSTRTARR